jgi:DNA polymerase III subunit epsilon
MNCIAFDLENSGLSPKKDYIIEIGAVKIIDDRIAESFSTFVSPGVALRKHITEITNITDDMLKGAPDEKEALTAFFDFMSGEKTLLGHGINYDYRFIKTAAARHGMLKYVDGLKGIDTLTIARKFILKDTSKKLCDLCRYMDVDPGHSHRALDDTIAAYGVYRVLEQKYYGSDPEAFKPKIMQYELGKNEPIMEKQKVQLMNLFKEKNIINSRDISSMTKSEASRYIDRIKSNQYA